MRVAHIMAGAVNGGAELFFERLCVAQHRAGDAVLPVIRREPARATRLRTHGLEPVELGFGGHTDLVTGSRLRRALIDFAPRVAVTWMNRASMHTVRGPWVTVGRLGGYYDLRYYRRCDHLVGNTRGIVDWLRRNGRSAAHTHYLPNFADDFEATSPATDLPAGRPRLLGLGRLHDDKGFDTLIRAIPALPDATLAIAGEGPCLDALQALARREGIAGRLHFLGWRRDPGALLKAADLFVCSSRVEPLGNMVIEAWSAECPVVAVSAAGPAELIRDGEDGLLTPMEDAPALAGAIGSLLRDPLRAQRMAGAGRQRFEAEFAQAPVLAAWRDFLYRVGR